MRPRKHGSDQLAALNPELVYVKAAGCKESSSVHRAVNNFVAVVQTHLSVVREELGRTAAIADMPLVSDTNSSFSSS